MRDESIPRKRYAVTTYLTCRLQLTVEAESRHMAKLRAEALAREKAQESGFEMDDFDEVSADVQEVKEVTLGPQI
jgi:hypothetical protein